MMMSLSWKAPLLLLLLLLLLQSLLLVLLQQMRWRQLRARAVVLPRHFS